MEDKVWWKGESGLQWQSGLLNLDNKNLVLNSKGSEIFTVPASEVKINFINPTRGFVLNHQGKSYWITFVPSIANLFLINRHMRLYRRWDEAIYRLTGNSFLDDRYSHRITLYYRIIYAITLAAILFGLVMIVLSSNVG